MTALSAPMSIKLVLTESIESVWTRRVFGTELELMNIFPPPVSSRSDVEKDPAFQTMVPLFQALTFVGAVTSPESLMISVPPPVGEAALSSPARKSEPDIAQEDVPVPPPMVAVPTPPTVRPMYPFRLVTAPPLVTIKLPFPPGESVLLRLPNPTFRWPSRQFNCEPGPVTRIV